MKANLTFYRIAVGLLALVVLVLSGALYDSYQTRVHQSPIIETQILHISGVEFEPGGGKYDVIVWSRVKLSNEWDLADLFQTRIEVKGSSVMHTFEWPQQYQCEPDFAEIREITGNGKKVFLLSCGMDFRVIQFTNGSFRFRPSMDRLDSVGSQSRFVDFNNDGRLEYIASLNYPQKFGDPKNYLTLPFPVIYRWSPERGFEEISREFPEFYREEAIPELRKLRQESEDPLRRPIFDSAIAYIQKRISSPDVRNMLSGN